MTITNSITNKKVAILYHPKCFSVPSKTLTTEDIDEDLSIEKLGMYNKPVGLSLLSLAKQDASDANIATNKPGPIAKSGVPVMMSLIKFLMSRTANPAC